MAGRPRLKEPTTRIRAYARERNRHVQISVNGLVKYADLQVLGVWRKWTTEDGHLDLSENQLQYWRSLVEARATPWPASVFPYLNSEYLGCGNFESETPRLSLSASPLQEPRPRDSPRHQPQRREWRLAAEEEGDGQAAARSCAIKGEHRLN